MRPQLVLTLLLLPTLAHAQDVAHVLAIEEIAPWGQTFAGEFGTRGMVVDTVSTPADLVAADLSHYSVVALTGGQSDNLIQAFNDRLDDLDDWVDAGGLLLVHGGVTSVASATGAVLPQVPGGNPTYALGTFPGCGEDLTQGMGTLTTTLPFVAGGYPYYYCPGTWPVSGGSLAHDDLVATGSAADVIVLISELGGTLLFERPHGAGLVIMGTLTYEYGYANNQDAGRIMDQELVLAGDYPCDDSDGDLICGFLDVCPLGDDTVDRDGDGSADACDPCPDDSPDDTDGDGVCDSDDICAYGNDNDDADADAFPDACDCEPYVATAYPGAIEVCSGIDDDCDGLVDEDDPDLDIATMPLWYYDLDGDGYGDSANAYGLACAQPADTVTTPGDCDDDDVYAYPGAPETVGDGIDQDCDGVDELPPGPTGDTGLTGAPTADTGLPTPTADTAVPTGDTATTTILPTADTATGSTTDTVPPTDTSGSTDTGGATDTGLPDPGDDPDSDGDGIPDSIDPQPDQAGGKGTVPTPAASEPGGCSVAPGPASGGAWLMVAGLLLGARRRE